MNDLRRLQLAADLYWTRNGRLPATLTSTHFQRGRYQHLLETTLSIGERYAYAVTSSDTYELCAASQASRNRARILVA